MMNRGDRREAVSHDDAGGGGGRGELSAVCRARRIGYWGSEGAEGHAGAVALSERDECVI